MQPRITLAGKDRLITEPVFHYLKIIITAYNALATASTADEQIAQITTILTALFKDDTPPLRKISTDELNHFLTVLPDLLGLEKSPSSNTKNDNTSWGDIYAHLAVSFGGFDYDYIDRHMTLSRLKELQGYLEKHPPLHLLGAAFMGYKKKTTSSVGDWFLAQAGLSSEDVK